MNHFNRSILSASLVAGLAISGCSKKAEEEAPAAAPPAAAPEAAAAPVESPAAAPTPAEAQPAARDWDKVVTEILQLRRGGITDEQRLRMLSLQDELSDAAVNDPAAREARNNLSRIINQR